MNQHKNDLFEIREKRTSTKILRERQKEFNGDIETLTNPRLINSFHQWKFVEKIQQNQRRE